MKEKYNTLFKNNIFESFIDASDATNASDTTDASDATNSTDTANATNSSNSTNDASDATNESDATNSTNATNASDETNATNESDASDTADASDANNASNTTDTADATNATDTADANKSDESDAVAITISNPPNIFVKTPAPAPNPTNLVNSINIQDKINRILTSQNIPNDGKQIYDYTIKEFYYNFINSVIEITKSIKDNILNSSDKNAKPSLIDILSNKKNLIYVGIMLILISIFLIPILY